MDYKHNEKFYIVEFKPHIDDRGKLLPFEYNKMRLSSGTSEEENKLMIENNLKQPRKELEELWNI